MLSSPVPGSGQKRMITMTMTRWPITDSGPPANCQTPPPAVGMTLMKKAYCQHPLHQHRQHTGRESRMMKRKMGERMSHTATCLVLNLIFLAQCPTCLTLNNYCIRIYFSRIADCYCEPLTDHYFENTRNSFYSVNQRALTFKLHFSMLHNKLPDKWTWTN